MVFSPYVDTLKIKENFVVYNFRNGKRIEVYASFFRILKESVEKGATVDQFLSLFENPNTKEYCKNMLNLMIEKEILYPDEISFNVEDIALTLKITDKCNLFCKHCCENSSVAAKELAEEEYTKIVDKVIEMRPKAVVITGGEPMTRPDFESIVLKLKKSGVEIMHLLTNGTLINQSNVDFLVSNFDKISISADGINEETCSKIRGKNVFEKIVKAVELLKSKGFEKIELSAVDSKYYTEEEFNSFCHTLGVTPLYRVFSAVGRAKDNLETIVDVTEFN